MDLKDYIYFGTVVAGIAVTWGIFKKTVDNLEKTAGELTVRIDGIESRVYGKIDELGRRVYEKIDKIEDQVSSNESRTNVGTMRVEKLEKYIGELYDKLNKLDLIAATQAENNRNRENQMDVVFKKLDTIYEMLVKRG